MLQDCDIRKCSGMHSEAHHTSDFHETAILLASLVCVCVCLCLCVSADNKNSFAFVVDDLA